MSQKKVDAYKKYKANRKEIQKKEKRMLLLEKLIAAVVCLVVVAWLGFSVYYKVSAPADTATTVVDTELNTEALDNYIYGLSSEVAE